MRVNTKILRFGSATFFAAALLWAGFPGSVRADGAARAPAGVKVPDKAPVITIRPGASNGAVPEAGVRLDLEAEELKGAEHQLLSEIARKAGIEAAEVPPAADLAPAVPAPSVAVSREMAQMKPAKTPTPAPLPAKPKKQPPAAREKPAPCEPSAAAPKIQSRKKSAADGDSQPKTQSTPAENIEAKIQVAMQKNNDVLVVKSKVSDLEGEVKALQEQNDRMHQALRNLQGQVNVLSENSEEPRGRLAPERYVVTAFGTDCEEEECPKAAASSLPATVIATRAILYSGPSRETTRLMTLTPGDKVSVERSQGEWSKVITARGVKAWLSSSALTFD